MNLLKKTLDYMERWIMIRKFDMSCLRGGREGMLLYEMIFKEKFPDEVDTSDMCEFRM